MPSLALRCISTDARLFQTRTCLLRREILKQPQRWASLNAHLRTVVREKTLLYMRCTCCYQIRRYLTSWFYHLLVRLHVITRDPVEERQVASVFSRRNIAQEIALAISIVSAITSSLAVAYLHFGLWILGKLRHKGCSHRTRKLRKNKKCRCLNLGWECDPELCAPVGNK